MDRFVSNFTTAAVISTKVLIIGGDSNVGIELYSFLKTANYDVYRTTREYNLLDSSYIYLDLENLESVKKIKSHFEVVILCAAITSVNKCEEFPLKAYEINYHNSLKVAEKFIANGSFMIFFSSSQVFNGENEIGNVLDATNPVTVYGKTKDLLEKGLLSLDRNISILRTSKVISKCFTLFDIWVQSLELNKPIYPFSDVYFSPISMPYLLSAVRMIIDKRITGLNQIGANRDFLYADAAYYIANKLNLSKHLISPKKLCETNINYIPKFTLLESTLFDTVNVPSPEEALDFYLNNKI